MKKVVLAVLAGTFIAISLPAMADDIDLKSAAGIKKFWDQHRSETGNGK